MEHGRISGDGHSHRPKSLDLDAPQPCTRTSPVHDRALGPDNEEDVLIVPTTPLFEPSAETLIAIAERQMNPRPLPPDVKLALSDSVAPWTVSPNALLQEYNATKYGPPLNAVAVGAVVFDALGRVLLIQRAHHDSAPDLWEVPAGKADLAGDMTVLAAVVRELWEEAGLVAINIRRLVPLPDDGLKQRGRGRLPGCECKDRHGRWRWCFLAFEVDVRETAHVVLDPDEHQAFLWATEDEVRDEQTRHKMPLPITNVLMKKFILQAFRIHSEEESLEEP